MKVINIFLIFSLSFSSSFAKEPCDLQLEKLSNSLKGKVKRREVIENLVEKGDFEEVYNVILKSHDNAHAKDGTLDGFSIRREIVKTKLHKINTDSYVSSYFQFFEKYHDTFGVIDTLTYSKISGSAKYTDAVVDADSWLKTYKNYNKTLQSKVNEGVQAQIQVKELKAFYKKKKPKLKDFLGTKVVKMNLSEIVDGKVVIMKKTFSEKSHLDLYYNKMKKRVEEIFSRNIYDDVRNNSELHGVMIEHEMMRRRINFLRDTISDISVKNQTKDQKRLFQLAEGLLADQSLMSRSDIVKYVQKKELKAELRAFFKSNRSKKHGRVRYKYGETKSFIKTIRGQTIEGISEQTNKFTTRTFIRYTLGVSAITTVAGVIFLPVTESPEYNKFRSYIANGWNNMVLKTVGTTSSLNECAKADRKWTVEEICYNEYLFEHLSWYHYKSQADKTYDYTTDPNFLAERERLTNIFLEKRDFKGDSEFHSNNKDYLTEIGYKAFLDDAFLELAVAERGNNKEVEDILEEIIEADYIYENDLLVKKLMDDLLKITDKEFVTNVTIYLERSSLGVKNIQESGKNVQGEQLNDFMTNLLKLENPKTGLIDGESEDNRLEQISH